ncbi:MULTISPECIES: ribonuclease HII [Bacillus]|uniref:Ribonuclease HII n=2 Tax=Bacillus TaxID=1386 RepID=A0A0M4FW35_9BACI|nr:MULTISPECIES: ribonuclease HII [Bacillus]ALC81038.1 ribonuclease HII [Bacillus gobiensis]MBP1079997.1 ribonuclease HII [Bacillus capparidis]MED1095385.1 ribonuclease HII [Bacillus capparidis]
MKKSVREIKEELDSIQEASHPSIELFAADERISVRELVRKWKKNKLQDELLQKQWNEMNNYETSAKKSGYQKIAGVDEAGRGPLAGPVVAAAVILHPENRFLGLTDSKKLSQKKREYFYDLLKNEALDIGLGIVEAETIDKINIYEASKTAMKEALANLKQKPDFMLIDALSLEVNVPQESIIKGDSKSVSIAAASCIAKVTRDQIMMDYARKYPQYGFEKHKGYGTKEHLEAIAAYGALPIHRRSFAPVRNRG